MHDSVILVLLVAAWLVVLLPMLARHRQEVRRTADAALASRVLHRGDSGIRLAARRGPAQDHPSDPQWVPEPEVDPLDETQEVAMAAQEQHEGHDPEAHELDEHYGADLRSADLRSVEVGGADLDGAEHHRAGRGGFDVRADAQARAARFASRRRVTAILLAAAVVTLLGGVLGLGFLWWPHLLVDVALVGYLTFLRRQTRIEAEVRERRLARVQRQRLGVDVVEPADEKWGSVPRRLRRPGAVVLEIDDEDPAFDELQTPLAPAEMRMPRAVGE